MHQASVGFHCAQCAHKGAQRVVTARSLRTRPLATMVLVGVNVAVWIAGLLMDSRGNILDSGNNELLVKGGLVSLVQYQLGGSLHGVAAGEWYRVVTAGFLHFGLLHLGLNMWALWVLGLITEQVAGRLRMVVIYVVALVAGSFGAMIVTPDALTAGASGAIYGLMGGLLVVARARGIAMRDTGLVTVLLLNLVFTFGVSGISIGGHIGGLIGGALAAFLVVDVPERIPSLRGRARDAYAVGLGLVLCVVLVAATVQVSKDWVRDGRALSSPLAKDRGGLLRGNDVDQDAGPLLEPDDARDARQHVDVPVELVVVVVRQGVEHHVVGQVSDPLA